MIYQTLYTPPITSEELGSVKFVKPLVIGFYKYRVNIMDGISLREVVGNLDEVETR